jgi:PAS domain S-box-containing protein
VERTFRDDQIIVSKTDLKGRITYVNKLFADVSGYTEDELIGAPHSVIRHPDMPRAVFHLLWDTLGQKREIFAYVKNLTSSGDHYWVLAHVTPTFGRDGSVLGYHSNRRTASRSALARIEPLYRSLLDEERRHSSKPEAAAAGRRALEAQLLIQNQRYDEFIWSLESDTFAGSHP